MFEPGGGDEAVPDGVLVTALEDAPPELIERHLGSLLTGSDDAFVALNDTGGA